MGWHSFANSLVIVGTYAWIVHEKENYQGKSLELRAGYHDNASNLSVGTISSFRLKSTE